MSLAAHQSITPISPRLFCFVPTQPLSRGRPSFLDWREKEKEIALFCFGKCISDTSFAEMIV